jgi:Holliday junction resolvase RusA-like endonuclease
VYDPARSAVDKQVVQAHATDAMGGEPPIEGPVEVRIWATWLCPKSHYRVRTPTPEKYRTGRPDIDNVLKAICDGLNCVAWLDDAQVVDTRIIATTAAQGEPASTIIQITEIDKEVSKNDKEAFFNA